MWAQTRTFDALIAGAIALFGLVEIWTEHLHPAWVATPLLAASGVALYWRRSYPLLVGIGLAVAAIVEGASGLSLHTAVAPVIALLLASWAIGAYESRPRAVLGLIVLVGGVWIAMAADVLRGTDHYVGSDVPWIGMLISAPGILGIVFGGRTRSLHAAERRADALERERLTAIAEERGRIARELHDVIAHSVSVMTVQAGAAEAMLDHGEPERALAPVQAVQETGRQTLFEMKRLVGMLREHDDELGLTPQPGLDGVERLLEQVREAGLPVELTVEGSLRRLPPGVDLSAYRIVQEALTNALKHAGEARARVRLGYRSDALEIEIADDGRPAPANGAGHGLTGMRERVVVFGGEFEAGPRPEGGFVVRALLPLETRV